MCCLGDLHGKNLKIKMPSGNFYRNGIAFDRIVGFQDLGAKDDFTTRALENLLKRKGARRCTKSSKTLF